MPGDLVAGQMFDHECNVLKGWWHPHALDKSAGIADEELIIAGSVCYLDQNADFRSGLPENVMGMFAWPNSTDFDVSADVGNIQSKTLMALPTTGPYELQTTEYDDAQTYAVNDYLTAWDAQLVGYAAALKGKVRPGRPYVNTLVGQCSSAPVQNENGKMWLSLWTLHLPIDLGES
jgi:hypothetical protein